MATLFLCCLLIIYYICETNTNTHKEDLIMGEIVKEFTLFGEDHNLDRTLIPLEEVKFNISRISEKSVYASITIVLREYLHADNVYRGCNRYTGNGIMNNSMSMYKNPSAINTIEPIIMFQFGHKTWHRECGWIIVRKDDYPIIYSLLSDEKSSMRKEKTALIDCGSMDLYKEINDHVLYSCLRGQQGFFNIPVF